MPHAHGSAARHVGDGLNAEGEGGGAANTVKRPPQPPAQPPVPQLLLRGSDTNNSTGRSGRQNAATRRNMRREERVTVQGPVKEQPPDGMSHGGGGSVRHALGGEGEGSLPWNWE